MAARTAAADKTDTDMLSSLSRNAASKFILLTLTFVLWSAPVVSQNLFEPVATVDDYVVTQFELQQRILLLEALRIPGDHEKDAIDALIEERLQLAEADRSGVYLDDETIIDGMLEFSKRSDLSYEDFLSAIGQQGVSEETFRDFVTVSLRWREMIGARFAPFVAISDLDIDRAISFQGTIGSARIQFSEIFLPTNSLENEKLSFELAPQIARITSLEEFSEAARRFSFGETRNTGGQVPGWVEISNLPPQIRGLLMKMKPGEVTEPIEIPNALALFQLRGIQETVAPAPRNMSIDYATYFIGGGRTAPALQRAADLRAGIDSCDDLYGIARDEPASVLERSNLPVSKIPRDYAIELAKLDEGEVSTILTRSGGQTLVFLMLCGRDRTGDAAKNADNEEEYREGISIALFNQRVLELADGLMGKLRAEAVITRR